jgi:hypothetical protein
VDASSPIQREHGHTEAALTAFGVEWTALRNNFYAEVLPDVIGALQIGEQWLIPEGQHIPANRHQPNMPHSVTLSRSEGSVALGVEMLRCGSA